MIIIEIITGDFILPFFIVYNFSIIKLQRSEYNIRTILIYGKNNNYRKFSD